MNSLNSRKLLPLIIAAIALSAAASVRPVQAAGLLYINPPQQGPFASGTTVTYQVKVANIDPLNGWDMMVKTDPAAINPASFTITPNLLAANFSQIVLELIHCVNGAGTGCTLADGPGIVHSAAVILGPAQPPTGTTSGVLFTITYTAGTGTFSLVHIMSDTITNGTGVPVAHTTQDGVYGNRPPTASFTATPASGAAPLPVAFDGSASSDPDLFDRVVEWDWTFGDGATAVTTVSTTSHTYNCVGSQGTFSATLVVKDTHGASSTPATQTIMLTNCGIPSDFRVSVSPTTDSAVLSTVAVTKTATVTVTLTAGTAAPALLTTAVTGPSTLVNAILGMSTLTPTAATPATTILTVTVQPGAATGVYTITVAGPADPTPADNTATYTLTVSAPPHFVHGKLSWTHHLSLAKSGGVQTFTAHVSSDFATTVIIHIMGTNSVGASFTASSMATPISAGVVTDITFMSGSVASFVNTKICFTATLTWGPTGAENPGINSKSGCFAVVP